MSNATRISLLTPSEIGQAAQELRQLLCKPSALSLDDANYLRVRWGRVPKVVGRHLLPTFDLLWEAMHRTGLGDVPPGTDNPTNTVQAFEALDEVIRWAEKKVTAQDKPPRSGKRGRPSDTDPKADKRVADAWGTGCYRTYEACGQALGMTRRQVKLAIDRHRKTGKRSRRT